MNFTPRELVSILKAAKGSGLRRLEYGELKLEFDVPPGEEMPDSPGGFERDDTEPVQFARPVVPPHIRQDLQDAIDNDPDIQALQEQTMMIEDPLGFERMIDREVRDAEGYQPTQQSVPAG